MLINNFLKQKRFTFHIPFLMEDNDYTYKSIDVVQMQLCIREYLRKGSFLLHYRRSNEKSNAIFRNFFNSTIGIHYFIFNY